LASNVDAELARRLENTKRLVDQLEGTAEHQDQLEAQIAALERDNEQLRRTLDELRSEIQLLRAARASIAEILRALAEDLSAA
jgi:cell division protein FtsB